MIRPSVALAMLGSAVAFQPGMLSSSVSGRGLKLRADSAAIAPRVRPSATSVQMIDEALLQGGAAAIAGFGLSWGLVAFVDDRGKKSSEVGQIDDQLMTRLASKMDGGEAENKFSGTDQTLDSLIAGMEEAQGVKGKEPKQKEKVVVEDDDGW
mmetsp:Transcript_23580/g.36872  ORF Transcript_23580/g.36872 Transcript_23580/m.36872 type:complete len:153 (-) Transcript_23580:753-1211(-)